MVPNRLHLSHDDFCAIVCCCCSACRHWLLCVEPGYLLHVCIDKNATYVETAILGAVIILFVVAMTVKFCKCCYCNRGYQDMDRNLRDDEDAARPEDVLNDC